MPWTDIVQLLCCVTVLSRNNSLDAVEYATVYRLRVFGIFFCIWITVCLQVNEQTMLQAIKRVVSYFTLTRRELPGPSRPSGKASYLLKKRLILKQSKSSDSVCIHCFHIVFSVCLWFMHIYCKNAK